MGPSNYDVGKFLHFFDPYPPTVGSFLVLSVGKFRKFLTPPPLEHADLLNWWSLYELRARVNMGVKYSENYVPISDFATRTLNLIKPQKKFVQNFFFP